MLDHAVFVPSLAAAVVDAHAVADFVARQLAAAPMIARKPSIDFPAGVLAFRR